MYINELTKALQDKYDTENRTGTHISDLVLCPRRVVHRRLIPQQTTMRELNFFTSGSSIHEALQVLAKSDERYEIEKEIKYEGMEGHVDIYDKRGNIPIEFKSSRTRGLKEPKAHHVQQLKYYMSILGADTGVLVYQFLMHFEDEPFKEFIVEMTGDERLRELNNLLTLQENFENGLESKKYMDVKGIFEDKNLNWLCKGCPLFDKCEKETKNES
jgi:CRISPR/Cas system-associated exonuclease Cas4 (RecB family)